MYKYFISFILFSLVGGSKAQLNSENNITPVSGYIGLKSFTYRLITTEYITNENDYFLGLTYDTMYLKFQRLEDSFHYEVRKFGDEKGTKWPRNVDTIGKIPLQIEFARNGKVKLLNNWKQFRDLFMSGFSAQVRAGMITATEFEDAKITHNDEGYIRRLVMEDINYIFILYGDTFNTEAEYIRLKTIRSPFSGKDYYFKGSLTAKRPEGTRNTVVFETGNKAGPEEKPLLMDEANEYQRKKLKNGEAASEIHAVGLNSEQIFQYNIAQGRMVMVNLSDVVSLDFSSRANIRKYEIWDVVEN